MLRTWKKKWNQVFSYYYFMLLQIKTIWINGPDRYNANRANNTQNYKPGTGLPKDIIYKIHLELNKDTELKKCFHGKTQNAN